MKKADNLVSKYPQANSDIVFTACCLHGVVYSGVETVRTFLKSLNMPREQVEKSIIAAFESQVSSIPESLEGKIVHDAHLIEDGKTFLVVKSLVVGTARGQSLEETLDYLNKNILNKGQCYLTEAREKYARKQEYLKDFMDSILGEMTIT